MSKRLIKRFRQFTDSTFKFAGWLAILLTTLVLAVTVYFFYDSYPKDGRPMDIELPVVPTSLHNICCKDPRSIKIDILKNASIRIIHTLISPELLKKILGKCIEEYGTDVPIRIRADRSLSFKQISPILIIHKDTGIYRIGFDVIAKDTDWLSSLSVSIWQAEENINLLRIELKKDQILLNGKSIDNSDSLKTTLYQLSSLDPDIQCLIIPDPDITLQRLIDIIYECERCGIYVTISDKPVPDDTKNIDKPAN